MEQHLDNRYNFLRKSSLFRGCFHEDENCTYSIIKAHSIQNNRILSKLAKKGDVLCIDFSKVHDGRFSLDRVGCKKASTFTGFCNFHDTSIFKPIELFDLMPNNREQEFLFAYRAFALGYYERHSTYNFYKKWLSESIPKNAHYINNLKEFVNTYENHLKLIESYKIAMNKNLDNKNYHKIQTDVLIWPGEYPVAVTSMFFILRDVEGVIVNNISGRLSPIFFTLFPQNFNTYILLSYLTKDKWRFKFIDKQIASKNIERQKVIISNLIATYIENFFISPDMWGNMPDGVKKTFYHIFTSSLGKNKPYSLAAYTDFNIFI